MVLGGELLEGVGEYDLNISNVEFEVGLFRGDFEGLVLWLVFS